MKNWVGKAKPYAIEILILTFATAIIAFAVYFFLYPSGASVSSITGLAIILGHVIPLQVSVITMILNVLLLIIGFFTVNKEFGYKTVYTSILLPVFLYLFETFLPDFKSLTGMPLLDVICYICVVSIGLAILFTRNASSGGLDIVAMILHKYFHADIGKAMSIAGMIIAASSFFVTTPDIAILSILGTYFNGIILDHFIFGQDIKRKVCIISSKMDEIRDFILFDLHSGASIYEVIGAYKMEKHLEIVTILDKKEYQKFKEFIEKTDPNAFITVYQVSSMNYRKKPHVSRPENEGKLVQEYLVNNLHEEENHN